jgi:hypothetical protein
MHVELQARDHIDIRSRVVVKHTDSGDVEWCGAAVECPCVASSL